MATALFLVPSNQQLPSPRFGMGVVLQITDLSPVASPDHPPQLKSAAVEVDEVCDPSALLEYELETNRFNSRLYHYSCVTSLSFACHNFGSQGANVIHPVTVS